MRLLICTHAYAHPRTRGLKCPIPSLYCVQITFVKFGMMLKCERAACDPPFDFNQVAGALRFPLVLGCIRPMWRTRRQTSGIQRIAHTYLFIVRLFCRPPTECCAAQSTWVGGTGDTRMAVSILCLAPFSLGTIVVVFVSPSSPTLVRHRRRTLGAQGV